MSNWPRTTTAAILAELRRPLIVDEIELPESCGVGQVLVRVRFSGICGSQLGEIDGVKGEDKFLPHLLGHEGCGDVVAIGPGVTRVKEGDFVVLHWRKGPGIEAQPPEYRWRGARLNAGFVTTFNRHAIVSENRLTVVPAGTDPKVAALFGCAVTTGFGVVQNNAKLKIGESIVVYGAGGIGLNIIQAAAMVSGHPVIAVDLYDAKLELARRMGATHVINASTGDPAAALREILGAGGADVFVDNTGVPKIIELGYSLTKPQGRLVLVGVPRKGHDISIYSLPIHMGKSLIGSFGGDAQPHEDIPRFVQMHAAGKLELGSLITHTDRLSNINDAIGRVRSGEIQGRCIIDLR